MEDTISVPNLLVTFTKGMTIQSCVCNTYACVDIHGLAAIGGIANSVCALTHNRSSEIA